MHGAGWRNAKHRAQWTSTLKMYASPVIGKMPVAAIDTRLVMKVLEPIWSKKTETASRVRGRLESILAWATVQGMREGPNPAQWRHHLGNLLPKPSKVKRVVHHPALHYRLLPALMARLRAKDGTTARALEFAILTATRTTEVRCATFDEFDLGQPLWSICADRMKARKEHRVPLSARASPSSRKPPNTASAMTYFRAPGAAGR